MSKSEQLVETLSKRIADEMPSRGQCLITLDNQRYLLNISANVGEPGACKLWIQGSGAIKVDEYGPIEPFDQLVFKARVLDSSESITLDERHGYSDIERGKEMEFLKRLLTEGEQDWFDGDNQDWGNWLGITD